MSNPAFCIICENKGADQLLSFRYINSKIVIFLYFLNPKFHPSEHLLWFVSEQVGNPEDRFSHDMAYLIYDAAIHFAPTFHRLVPI